MSAVFTSRVSYDDVPIVLPAPANPNRYEDSSACFNLPIRSTHNPTHVVKINATPLGSLRGQALLCRQGDPENQASDLEGEFIRQRNNPKVSFGFLSATLALPEDPPETVFCRC